MDRRYQSSIPSGARDRVITDYHREDLGGGGSAITLKRTECRYRGKVVGLRHYDDEERLQLEIPLQAGKCHGVKYEWFDEFLSCAEPYWEGLQHGTAKQWADDGRLMGTYNLQHGTGVDLWRTELCKGSYFISELRTYRDGALDGYTWQLWRTSLWSEAHYQAGREHGIHRRWNLEGRLKRGYPRYYVHGEKVTQREYLRAAAADATLPPFRTKDNLPVRVFAPALQMQLGVKRRVSRKKLTNRDIRIL